MAHAPSGVISLWNGPIATIPAGWVLCDGNNGTPDLRDQFVRGASVAIPPGSVGGNDTHQHTFVTDGHDHDIPDGSGILAGAGKHRGTDSSVDTGQTLTGSSLPPFYALAYIMKT